MGTSLAAVNHLQFFIQFNWSTMNHGTCSLLPSATLQPCPLLHCMIDMADFFVESVIFFPSRNIYSTANEGVVLKFRKKRLSLLSETANQEFCKFKAYGC